MTLAMDAHGGSVANRKDLLPNDEKQAVIAAVIPHRPGAFQEGSVEAEGGKEAPPKPPWGQARHRGGKTCPSNRTALLFLSLGRWDPA